MKQAKLRSRKRSRVAATIPVEPPHALSGAFEMQLRATVARLRASVAEVLGAVGANMRVPHSITRDFGIDKSMASKLARVMREADPYAAALDVPGEEAMRIFTRSMRDAGAPPRALESLRESVASFQDMVKTHCGDRATLEMLAAAANHHDGPSLKQRQHQQAFRKSMFRGASLTFGVQARTQVSADFISPSPGNSQQYDVTLVNGLIDLRRIRSDVVWAVSSMRTIDRDGRPGPLVPVQPLDPHPESGNSQAMLLRDFCSTPVPELHVTDTKDSVRRFELPEGPVGSTSAVTLFTGWTYRNASFCYRDQQDYIREHFVMLNTPVESVIHDLFVHKDLAFARRPTNHLYNQLPGTAAYPNCPRDRGLLPMYEPLEDLSGCPVHAAHPDVPNYSSLVDFTFKQLGFSANDFYGVRVQLPFPPIPSMMLYRYELPDKP